MSWAWRSCVITSYSIHYTKLYEDLLFGGLDAEVAEHLLVRGLGAAAGDDDGDAADPEQRHGAERHAPAAEVGAGAGEGAVAQLRHLERRLVGRIARDAALAAEPQRDRGAFAGVVSYNFV